MVTLMERNEKEFEMHKIEVKELLRQIDDDEKRHAFMMIKANEREDYISEEEEKKRKMGELQMIK